MEKSKITRFIIYKKGERKMKILSIGNSFSQDAQRYLYRLAKKAGDTFKTVNLYIGGCSLRTHYINALEDKADYWFEYNGNRNIEWFRRWFCF